MSAPFSSRTAVIAGAGLGLGAALARRLAREGCRVHCRSYWQLARQNRSAWTFEWDLRPDREKFFD